MLHNIALHFACFYIPCSVHTRAHFFLVFQLCYFWRCVVRSWQMQPSKPVYMCAIMRNWHRIRILWCAHVCHGGFFHRHCCSSCVEFRACSNQAPNAYMSDEIFCNLFSFSRAFESVCVYWCISPPLNTKRKMEKSIKRIYAIVWSRMKAAIVKR